jgi:virginiamycin B lyase
MPLPTRVLLAALACLAIAPATASATFGQVTVVSNREDLALSLAVGADGNIWAAGGLGVTRFLPDGHEASFPIDPTPFAVNVGPGPGQTIGFAAMSDRLSPAVGLVTLDGVVTAFRSSDMKPDSEVDGVTAGPDGNLWFTYKDVDHSDAAIGRLTPAGQITLYRKGLLDDAQPGHIIPGPSGDLWFTDDDEGALGRITPAGAITEFVFRSGGDGPPTLGGIAEGSDGNVWLAVTQGDHASGPSGLVRVTPDPKITNFTAGLLPSGNSELGAMALGSDGNLYFADNSPWGTAIGQVTPSGRIMELPIHPAKLAAARVYAIVATPGLLWLDYGGRLLKMSIDGTPAPAPAGALQTHISCRHGENKQSDWGCDGALVHPQRGSTGPLRVVATQLGLVVATGSGRIVNGKLDATLRLGVHLDTDYDLKLTANGPHTRRTVYATVDYSAFLSVRPKPKHHT